MAVNVVNATKINQEISEVLVFVASDSPRLLYRHEIDAQARLVFSRDAKTLVCSTENWCYLWSASEGTELYRQASKRAELSPDGTRLAIAKGAWTAQSSWTFELVDWIRQMPVAPAVDYKYPIISMHFSSDGKYLAIAAGQHSTSVNKDHGEVRVLDATNGLPVRETLTLEEEPQAVYFHRDNDRFVVCERSMLTIAGVNSKPKVNYPLHGGNPLDVAFDANGSQLLLAHGNPVQTGGRSGGVYPFGSGYAVLMPIRLPGEPDQESVKIEHEIGAIQKVAFDDDGRYAITAGQNGFGFWDSRTGQANGQGLTFPKTMCSVYGFGRKQQLGSNSTQMARRFP